MNRQDKGKIEWCDWTWNPVTGCLGPNGDGERCWYCYAYGIAKRFHRGFAPELHPDRFIYGPEQRRQPSRIFVVSGGDLFGEGVPDSWIQRVLEATYRAQRHTYIFLTRHPWRCDLWSFPVKSLVGITLTGEECFDRQEKMMNDLMAARVGHAKKFVSFEPLLGHIAPAVLDKVQELDWVIFGARTGNAKGPRLNDDAYREAFGAAFFAPVLTFDKSNISQELGDVDLIQNFPCMEAKSDACA